MTRPSRQDRWLFVDGSVEFGGHEIMLLRWARELSRQAEVRPRILARAESKLLAEAAALAAPGPLPRHTGSRFALALRDVFAFVRIVRKMRPALCILAEGCVCAQPWFVFAARALGCRVAVYVPLVESSEHMGFRHGALRDRLIRLFYANAPHAWITITAEQAHTFSRWAHVRRPIHTLPNAIGENMERRAERIALGRAPIASPLRILVLGRLEPHQKGLDALLDYLEREAVRLHDVTVSFVGTGPFEQEIQRRRTRHAELQRIVRLHPWSDPLEALCEHDVLLIPSRYEGVPLVMLEAMAMGLPVVASDLPGTRGFLPADYLFARGDFAAAFAIAERLRAESERQRVVQRNREVFLARASGAAFRRAVSTLTAQLHASDSSRRDAAACESET